jgi:hypothetical protein
MEAKQLASEKAFQLGYVFSELSLLGGRILFK